MKTVLGTGFVWAYYLGYAIAMLALHKAFALFSRKILLIVFSFAQGLMVVCHIVSSNMLVLLGFRALLGFFAVTDVLLKDYIEDSSTKFSRTSNILIILFSPRAISFGLGSLLTSFTLSRSLIILPNDNILGLPIVVVSIMVTVVALLTSVLISDEELNVRKNVLAYVETEGEV